MDSKCCCGTAPAHFLIPDVAVVQHLLTLSFSMCTERSPQQHSIIQTLSNSIVLAGFEHTICDYMLPDYIDTQIAIPCFKIR